MLSGRTLLHAASFLASLALFTLDVAGLRTYSDRASADIANVLLGHLYPPTARDRILVVTVGDPDLANYAQPFLPRYDFHARNLADLSLLGARAVLVDILFEEPHRRDGDDPSTLRDAVLSAKAAGTHVILAARSSASDGKPHLIEELSGVAEVAAVPRFLNFVGKGRYCGNYLLTPIRESPPERCATPPNGTRTGAWALAARTCGAGQTAECPADAGEDFQLIWGVGRSELADTRKERIHCNKPLSWLSLEGRPIMRERCPYHAELSVRSLRCLARVKRMRQTFASGGATVTTAGQCAAVWEPEQVVRLLSAFEEALVVYGMSRGASPDMVRPPTTPGISGGHFHAMALDNILTFHGEPKGDGLQWAGLSPLGFVYLLATFLIEVVARDHRAAAAGRPRRLAWLNMGRWGVHLLAGCAFAATGFFLLDLAPVNWVGTILTGIVVPSTLVAIARNMAALWGANA